jgi:hypothetical protein
LESHLWAVIQSDSSVAIACDIPEMENQAG